MDTDERKKKVIARRVRRCTINNKLLNAKYHDFLLDSTSGDEDANEYVSSTSINSIFLRGNNGTTNVLPNAKDWNGGRTQRKKNDNAENGTNNSNSSELNTKVVTSLGELEGHILKTYNDNEFLAFEGIPYAKPPIGELRFQEPEPMGAWNGIFLANKLHICMQYTHYRDESGAPIVGNEDCLYLNIYIPKVNKEKLMDVIVFIHGGAFMFGSGGSYGPLTLLDQEIVYVTLNYRLGPLGFLSTEDHVVPGNNGLKDQLLALKWIKNNIVYFGGNPDSITLTGMSAGGASAQLHAFSTLSKGLFHRGISQSGCALNPWVMAEKSLEKSQKLAAHLGCPTTSTTNLIRCLKKVPAYDIVNAVSLFMVPWLYNPISPFGVVVDKWSPVPFLSAPPQVTLKEGKVVDVPWIFSHVESEGLYPASEFISKKEYLQYIDDNWNEVIPHILDFNNTLGTNDKQKVLQKIRNFYFGNESIREGTFSKLVNVGFMCVKRSLCYNTLFQMVSDRLFLYTIEQCVKVHSTAVNSPVFHYHFYYRGVHSKSERLSGSNENYGASHGDDTVYVLSSDTNMHTTASDKNMTALLLNLWMSFSRKGIPEINNVKWLPVSKELNSELVDSLKIDSPSEQKMTKISFGNSNFWNSLPLQENKVVSVIRHEL
ncbi:hypothetical protein FQA39_LY09763 [Lamprigera yunnana]|nr:hypothetical protein FQA39_LY09763 [Lamprigera yunnana]